MDFRLVLDKLTKAFADQDIHYAVIGGFALGFWGVPRSTVDLDLLVDRDDLDKLDIVMKDLLYECKYRTENVSQFVAPVKQLGEVDCLHAFRNASKEILERAVQTEIFDGALKVRVSKPEDLVGLKLQALNNDPSRMAIDRDDIEKLLQANKEAIDWELVEQYFSLFDMGGLLKEIRKD